MICAGIDAGSRAIKGVLYDTDLGEMLATGMVDQGIRQESLARGLFEELLGRGNVGAGDVAAVVATGYGRNLIRFADRAVTEITCHATGVRRLVPRAASVVEIGGQDSKVIRLSANGGVQDFAMNDRCAAGTGRFLEMVAVRLEVDLDQLGDLARASRAPAAISSMCVVFAETEIVGLLASGTAPEDIVAGVQQAVAMRVAALAGRGLPSPVCFTGGVASVPGMAEALGAALDQPVDVAPSPHLTGALGAALHASALRQGRANT